MYQKVWTLDLVNNNLEQCQLWLSQQSNCQKGRERLACLTTALPIIVIQHVRVKVIHIHCDLKNVLIILVWNDQQYFYLYNFHIIILPIFFLLNFRFIIELQYNLYDIKHTLYYIQYLTKETYMSCETWIMTFVLVRFMIRSNHLWAHKELTRSRLFWGVAQRFVYTIFLWIVSFMQACDREMNCNT